MRPAGGAAGLLGGAGALLPRRPGPLLPPSAGTDPLPPDEVLLRPLAAGRSAARPARTSFRAPSDRARMFRTKPDAYGAARTGPAGPRAGSECTAGALRSGEP
ncbi:hypothetical protein Sxan_76550 [Streptomyces xanthophaeus]|uniref:Uncharacterized protein n=1 Tax=Streptomyces xanthophaeus TaxID=67385 RepID=A0A919LGP3_9ACTN|nr:hypothetical protein Sxan_76550 [Streptomyces xanthophaeus]